ncbi:hypothetical protein CKO_03147 [Citrobacter koseri ATCC BAA-895]|uniref:Uncharacterized protein n=1 Tax=Citrobacter koseri (strain ATCC BAA-895 / CDC 4225-83 / SGSC4696) TaxID=290338 RepID=A8AL75_CITK8|nr:hypothetical protein CKO_03147 [Citrobacter koseri ATCC BAA-895]
MDATLLFWHKRTSNRNANVHFSEYCLKHNVMILLFYLNFRSALTLKFRIRTIGNVSQRAWF